MEPEESGAGAPAARGGDATVVLPSEKDRPALDRYRAVFFHSPQPMMTYDATTLALVDANDAAVRQYGYARDDLMKMTAADLWPAEGSEQARIVLSGPVPRPATVETHRQNGGGLRLVRMSVCALSSDPRERLLLVDDVTDRVEEMSSSTLEAEDDVLVSNAIRDIGERKNVEDQRAQLAALVESSADAIIGKTLEGVVTSWNPAATHLFGYSSAEMIGRSITLIIPRDRMSEESEILKHLASGEVERLETVRLHKSGRELHVSVTSSPVRDSDGRLVGASKVVRDITERRTAELALARARDAAEAANRELESFSYSVAHDLRAPLRGMSGFAHLLVDTYGDSFAAEARDWLQEIILNARKMAALIDALLLLARVARSEPRYEMVDLSAVVRATTKQLSSTEPERHVEWLVQDGLTAELDAGLAHALIENLVGNAWKFTRGAAPARIEFGALEVAGARTFFVRDNGAGFDMAMSRRLFGPFQRLHSEHEFPGTGIGLATVQRIVHRHGGRVWAQAAVNAGATFYFTLPAQASVAA